MIIFIYGADTFRARRFLNELKNKFIRDLDPDAHNLSWLDGSTTTLLAVAAAASTGSLFVKKRLVVIDNIFQNKKTKIFSDLADYLKKLAADNDNILIFRDEELNTKDRPVAVSAKKLFVLLSGQPYSREFPALTGGPLLAFIKKEAALYKKDIASAAAAELANRTGGDLWLIAGEIKKLAYRTAGQSIALADVQEMTAASYDQNIFALTDALSDKNKKLALRLLAEQYAAGASDEYLLTMLIRQFKILLQIRTALDNKISPAKMAGELKLHPFVVQKGSRQAANFRADLLQNYLNRLLRLDWLNKKGQADLTTELTLLMAGL
jgi:DNA polymerase-3 subunit delta